MAGFELIDDSHPTLAKFNVEGAGTVMLPKASDQYQAVLEKRRMEEANAQAQSPLAPTPDPFAADAANMADPTGMSAPVPMGPEAPAPELGLAANPELPTGVAPLDLGGIKDPANQSEAPSRSVQAVPTNLTKTSTTTTTKETDTGPLAAAHSRELKAVDALIAADTAAVRAKEAQDKLSAIQDEQVAQQVQADREANNIVIRNKQAQIDKEAEDIAKTAKIDPDKFWADRGTGNRILAAISIGMGAYAASRNGGENTALKIIDSAIDRDIAAQKANTADRRVGLADKRNALQDLTVRLDGDAKLAENVYKMGAIRNIQNGLRDQASKAADKQIAAKYEAMAAGLESKYAALEMQSKEKVVSEVKTNVIPEATKFSEGQQTRIGQLAKKIRGLNRLEKAMDDMDITRGLFASIGRKMKERAGMLSAEEAELLSVMGVQNLTEGVSISGSAMNEPTRRAINATLPNDVESLEAAQKKIKYQREESYLELQEASGGVLDRANPSSFKRYGIILSDNDSAARYGAKPAGAPKAVK